MKRNLQNSTGRFMAMGISTLNLSSAQAFAQLRIETNSTISGTLVNVGSSISFL